MATMATIDDIASICGRVLGTIDLSGRINYSFTGYPSSTPPPGPWVDCTIKLKSAGSKFAVHFTHFRLSDCRSSVYVKEEDADGYNRHLRAMPSSLCRLPVNEVLDTIYITEWTTLVIEVTGDYFNSDDGFSLIYNLFTNEPCNNHQHACNNGRCIKKALKCSGYNPCGDGSDCPDSPKKLSAGEIVGIVIGVACADGLIVLLCIVGCKVGCCKAKHPVDGATSDRQRERTVPQSQNSSLTPRMSTTERTHRPSIERTHRPTIERTHRPSSARRLAAEQWTIDHPSDPPDYSIVDYVSRPTKSTHTPDMYVSREEVLAEDHIDISGVHSEHAPLHDRSRDNVDTTVDTTVTEYIAPPPLYDVVVNYQDLYNVSSSRENV